MLEYSAEKLQTTLSTSGSGGGCGPFFGSIGEFNLDTGSSVKSYLERAEIFFQANDIQDSKKPAVVLLLIGEVTYNLLRSFCAPALPSTKTYTQLKTLLINHLEPAPLVISERFHFH